MTDSLLLYEDALMKISLSSQPMVKGHVEVRPVREVSFLGDLTDEEVTHLFFGASYAASALFELVGAQGTNMILNESDDQLCIHVLARFENDGINFLWQPNKASPEDLSSSAKDIKDKIDYLLWAKENPEAAAKSKQGPSIDSKPAKVIKSETDEKTGEKKVNYLLRSLRRIP